MLRSSEPSANLLEAPFPRVEGVRKGAILLILVSTLLGCSKPVKAPERAGKHSQTPGTAIAKVLGRSVTSAEIGLDTTVDTRLPGEVSCSNGHPLSTLSEILWNAIAADYIAKSGLKATPAEIQQMSSAMERDMKQDLVDWAILLKNIEGELKDGTLSDEKRKELTQTKETFSFLIASFKAEAATSQGVQKRDKSDSPAFLAQIEQTKLDQALYKKYGGIVAVTKFGQFPVGARVKLLRQYKKEGKLEFLTQDLERRFWEWCDAPPKMQATPDEVDLTPFWQLPVNGRGK